MVIKLLLLIYYHYRGFVTIRYEIAMKNYILMLNDIPIFPGVTPLTKPMLILMIMQPGLNK
jgi:hypothetical protein